MRESLIIDRRNICESEDMKAYGFEYLYIG
jgi:hypothetical protein